MPMSDVEHKSKAPASIRCFVLTVSDTRTETTDTSGSAIVDLLTLAGHTVVGKAIVKDDPVHVRDIVMGQLTSDARTGAQVVITTGGTGISSRDRTFETIDGLLEKRLDGFGELFRMLSYEEIGSAAIMSRAAAGLANGKILISLPG